MSFKTIPNKLVKTFFNIQTANLYSSRFRKYGPSPSSVLWLNDQRQLKRFEVIANSIATADFTSLDTIVDFGCGYGAFLEFLYKQKQLTPAHYYGLDLSVEMIEFCQSKFKSKRVSFFKKSQLDFDVSFSIISGAFNRSATYDVSMWENYVFSNLSKIWGCTKKAMIFNFQYTNLDVSKISEDKIYYICFSRLRLFLNKLGGNPSLIYNQSIPDDVTILLRTS